MKHSKTLTIAMIVAGILLILAALAIVYVLFGTQKTTTISEEPIQTGNPFSNIGTTNGGGTSSGTYMLYLNDGTRLAVPDFTKEAQPVWVSKYEYQVTGSPYENFLITFLEPDQDNPQGEFLVTLLSEPLKETREAAKAALKAQFNITDEQVCALDTNVAVGPGLSDIYGPDQDIGFSGCEGAVAL